MNFFIILLLLLTSSNIFCAAPKKRVMPKIKTIMVVSKSSHVPEDVQRKFNLIITSEAGKFKAEDEKIVKDYIEDKHKNNISKRFNNGDSFLDIAIHNASLPWVIYLINNGAAITDKNLTNAKLRHAQLKAQEVAITSVLSVISAIPEVDIQQYINDKQKIVTELTAASQIVNILEKVKSAAPAAAVVATT